MTFWLPQAEAALAHVAAEFSATAAHRSRALEKQRHEPRSLIRFHSATPLCDEA